MAQTLEERKPANLAFPQLLVDPAGEHIIPRPFRELSLVSYTNPDNAPLAKLYPQLSKHAGADPAGPDAGELQRLLSFIG